MASGFTLQDIGQAPIVGQVGCDLVKADEAGTQLHSLLSILHPKASFLYMNTTDILLFPQQNLHCQLDHLWLGPRAHTV